MNATLVVPSGGGYFEGHFPQCPILPGVAEVALVLEALAREAGRAIPLRGINFVRLRQLVLPGDRLELRARQLESGTTRIDIERAGVLVANGELILGSPDPTSADARAHPPSATRMGELPPLDALLPHRPPMRLVTAVVGDDGATLTCIGRVSAQCALASGGSAPALAALELAAQAAATWEALQRWRDGGAAEPRIGYLVAMRGVQFFAECIAVEEDLLTTVALEAAAPPLTHYRVEVVRGEAQILRGTIATFLAG